MFGYIKPHKNELKVGEYDLFKSYYCGLCKELGKEFNHFVRLGLNYDLTFLALLLSSINSKAKTIYPEACLANPFKKRPIIKKSHAINYSANISIILAYSKLLDDWKDDKSIPAIILSTVYLLPLRKVKKTYGDKYKQIKIYLKQLNVLENNKCDIIDEVADIFGKIMELVFTPSFLEDNEEKRIMAWLGYNIGRWIYIIDAFDDIEEDIKKNNYNPLLLQYKYNKGQKVNDFKDNIKDEIEISLTFTLDNIAKSFELLNIKHNKPILENIIYMGMQSEMEKILIGSSGDKGENSL